MKICTTDQMRSMDHTAISEYGISADLLMENAGLAVYSVIQEQFGVHRSRFAIVCGTGNNGGDGFVVARKLHSSGGTVRVFIVGDPANLKGSARSNYAILGHCGIPETVVGSGAALQKEMQGYDAVVDALFGTGLTRQVEGLYAEVVSAIARFTGTVFSVDVPSGINGDTGEVMGVAVRAHHTITFGTPKTGSVLYPGWEHGGRLYVSHISMPSAITENDAILCEINTPLALPERKVDAHKGDFGDALFVSGAAGYYGGPYLCSYSFLMAGGGYSRLAAPSSLIPHIAAKAGEVVFLPQKETASGAIDFDGNRDGLVEASRSVDMVVIGPGMSLDHEAQKLIRYLVAKIDRPLILDGDGLTAVVGRLDLLKSRRAPTIITPHAGELARLLGVSAGAINADRITVARRTAAETGAVTILKGAHSLIVFPDGRVFVNLSGNSGMATAGSGDVLAGAIAAMFGLGLPVSEAARAGVFVHGLSGDIAAEKRGEDGLSARDILRSLPRAVRWYRKNHESLTRTFYGKITLI